MAIKRSVLLLFSALLAAPAIAATGQAIIPDGILIEDAFSTQPLNGDKATMLGTDYTIDLQEPLSDFRSDLSHHTVEDDEAFLLNPLPLEYSIAESPDAVLAEDHGVVFDYLPASTVEPTQIFKSEQVSLEPVLNSNWLQTPIRQLDTATDRPAYELRAHRQANHVRQPSNISGYGCFPADAC